MTRWALFIALEKCEDEISIGGCQPIEEPLPLRAFACCSSHISSCLCYFNVVYRLTTPSTHRATSYGSASTCLGSNLDFQRRFQFFPRALDYSNTRITKRKKIRVAINMSLKPRRLVHLVAAMARFWIS